ncbi:LOW QUALITY PROTEIN: hypothetical protein TorRG33x02_218620 [Trema orientale]|uniref:Uncharacterized protein n=1 Tax=Trema orientale TaxID=63057 RepID=A0A2P5E9Y1_TREOI|nr:LOW QUALITY PROTEIN: hypothetical protein TorRG33x02_218620 [Trema orientale]
MCTNCDIPATIGEISIEEHLRIKNARLKDKLKRVCALAGKFLGSVSAWATSMMAPPLLSLALEIGVGSNGFGGLNTIAMIILDF